jgi:prevent-host-death family protein
MDTNIYPVTALRPNLLKCVTQASKIGKETIITKNGKPAAVLMGFDEWESWKETIEILSDPKLMRRIRKSERYFAKGGKGKTIKEVFGE